MPLRTWRIAAIALVFSVLNAPVSTAARDILVFAAASTSDALDATLGEYSEQTGVVVRASYASSGALARQIDRGAPAALFLSANPDWAKWLDSRARLARNTRLPLLGNRLVLIEPKPDDNRLRAVHPIYRDIGANLLRHRNQRLALADPEHVPAGAYAKDALTSLGLWDVASAMAVRARDVRAALLLVERGETGLGIVYQTDAKRSSKVSILNTFPETSHPRILYELAIVREQDSPATRRLYDFLLSQPAKKVFARFGFITDPDRFRMKIDNGLPHSR